MPTKNRRSLPSVALLCCAASSLFFACGAGGVPTTPRGSAGTLTLDVDASQSSRRMLHAHLVLPARPGPMVLQYPKWIPGEHAPTGPISGVAGLAIRSGGKVVEWERDPIDMFSLRCTVPSGASTVEVDFDFLTSSDDHGFSSAASQTESLVDISWNQLLVYPAGRKAEDWQVKTSLRLPAGWKFGTSLPIESEGKGVVAFRPVSLVTLIDAPVVAGAHYKRVDLGEVAGRSHALHVVGDSVAAVEVPEEPLAGYRKLVREALAIFGAPHYSRYDFLYTLSDHVAWFGLEHHESSDNRDGERTLIDEGRRKLGAGLLPHELVHSWNGKYRRPFGLLTPDYQGAQRTELLWVYEGLTSYLGDVLTARSGLWTTDDYLKSLAYTAAYLDQMPGRAWRPLLDTTIGVQTLLDEGSYFRSYRRGLDYYDEGELLWLEADVLVRTITHDKKSLDDFCFKFFGGDPSGPKILGYNEEDVIKALNEVAPYDWRGFWNKRIRGTESKAPIGGIEQGGYKLVYDDKRSDFVEKREDATGPTFFHSLGFRLDQKGTLVDVSPSSPAGKADLSPGSSLVAVNGRRYSADRLRDAVRTATPGKPIELLVEVAETFRTVRLDYSGGLRYPRLERDPNVQDRLSAILVPRAGALPAATAKPSHGP